MRSRYRAALIDEFQDTDPVQCGILRRYMAAPACRCFCRRSETGHLPRRRYPRSSGRPRSVDRSAVADTNQRSVPLLIEAVNHVVRQWRQSGGRLSIPVSNSSCMRRSSAALHIDGEDAAPMRFLLLPAEIGRSAKNPFGDVCHRRLQGRQRNCLAADAGGAGQAYIDEQGLAAPAERRRYRGAGAERLAQHWRARDAWRRLASGASAPGARECFAAEGEAAAGAVQAIAAPTRRGLVRTCWWRR